MTRHPDGVMLNDFVDGALTGSAAADVARHLAMCEQCRALADELRAVRDAARTLEPIAPPAYVWEHVRGQVHRHRVWRRTATWGAVALAASLLIAVFVLPRWMPRSSPEVADVAAAVPTVVADMTAEYGAALAPLEQIAMADRTVLDAETLGAFDTSLAAVDRAIDESRAAVTTEPDNDDAQTSLLESFRMKLSLLQETVAIINELRQDGSAAPAAPES